MKQQAKIQQDYEKYSVLMPLYIKDNPDWFKTSVESIINQTIKPTEIVIVCDGEVSKEVNDVLDIYENKNPGLFKIYHFNTNRGLGITLADGIKLCTYEIIVRMDSDDYSIPTRVEEQLSILRKYPEYDVIGSNVFEFEGNIENVKSHVVLPEKHKEIVRFAKKRCPVRHPTLLMRKKAVLRAGNYRDFRHAQDYDLIVRMIMNGSKVYNIQKELVYMRISSDFYRRRGGWNQMKLIVKIKKGFLDIGFYSPLDFLISAGGNAFICLVPNILREKFYKKVLRK